MDGLSKEEFEILSLPLGDLIADGKLKIALAIDDKRRSFVKAENKKFVPKKRKPFFSKPISDHLGEGVQGVLNHVDGKMYDSKSNFEKAVKAKGCRVVGNDWNKSEYKTPLERGVRGNFDVRGELKEAIQKVSG